MVLVFYILDNHVSILQTKFSDREGHEARRVGLEAVPLDQHVKGRHGERESGVAIRPHAMHDLLAIKPTVSLGVTYVVVCTYGYDDGRIAPTRCAVIDGGLGDRCSQRRACRIPPARARSARIVLAAASRPASTAAPDGFRRSRTTPRSTTRPCGDASPARCAPGTRPSPPRLFPFCSSLQCTSPR